MNRSIVAASLAALVATGSAWASPADVVDDLGSQITARNAIVMDAATGAILWSREPHKQVPPASTTKILTTALALESGRRGAEMLVSTRAEAQPASKLYFKAGQQVSLEDLLYSLMLRSANDAAVVVAEGLAGSVERFAVWMNQRAREIGATRSRFRNPHGLPDPQHVSTAYDMALILRYAIRVPGFREVARTSSRTISIETPGKVRPASMTFRNRNRLLQGAFVEVIGKTGYTRAARRCFAGTAELNGRRVLVVILGATDMWGDTQRLLEWSLVGDGVRGRPTLLQMAKVQVRPPLRSVGPRSVVVRSVVDRAPSQGERAPSHPVPAHKAPAPVAVAAVPPPAPPAQLAARTQKRAEPKVETVAQKPAKAPAAQKVAAVDPPEPVRVAAPRAKRKAAVITPAMLHVAHARIKPKPAPAPAPAAPPRAYRPKQSASARTAAADPKVFTSSHRSGGGWVKRGCTGTGCGGADHR